MVKAVIKKVKPAKGFSHFLHFILVSIIPVLAYVFVKLDFFTLAIVIVLMGKWRMLAIKPRHWLAHIRTNSVDLIVSLSLVAFMIASYESSWLQLVWLAMFELWLLYIKPKESTLMVSIQALSAQALGLIALFLAFETVPYVVYVFGAFIVSFFSARHFFNSFEEDHGIQYSWFWGYFAASLVWVLSHWLLFYKSIAMPAVIITIIGYGLASLYFLHEHDKLTKMVKRQVVFIVFALLFVIISFANWGQGVIK